MNRLEIKTLGGVSIRIGGTAVESLSVHKAQALLVYLALSHQPQSRQTLSGLLWGDMPEAKARRNLRVTLTRVRDDVAPYLLIERRSLGIDPESEVWIDVQAFEEALHAPNPTLAQLQTAAALYRGEFLQDFNLLHAPLFEEWQRPLRERYRQMALETFYRLTKYHTEQRQYTVGIEYATQLLMIEPWMEEAHRQLMLMLALTGQRSAALTQYEKCCDILSEGLGVEPAEATVALYEQILHEEIEPDVMATRIEVEVEAERPIASAPVQIPAAVKHFVGRAALLEELTAALVSGEQAAMHALVGMGGVGKSSVAIKAAETVKAQFPDGILWANVGNSEPMAVLESWAAMYGFDFTHMADLEAMAAAFRGVLSNKQVLVVLDNVNSANRARPLLPSGARCRVLFTTRDHDVARVLDARVWPLAVLPAAHGRLLLTSLLGEERVTAEPEAAADICETLQNLPLALEIAGQRLRSRPRRRLADMAQRLHDETQRLSLLRISDREVRASFGISWETLDTGQRQVFVLLGLFNGRSFAPEALSHIATMDELAVEDHLFDLVNLSLLQEDGENRYRQHPLLADFAREQGEAVWAEASGRFVAYYLTFARTHQRDYEQLRPEWDNLTASLTMAHEQALWPPLLELTEALREGWFTRGRFAQAVDGLELALTAAEQLQDGGRKGRIYLDLGVAYLELSDYEQANAALRESVAQFAQVNDDSGRSDALYHLARIALEESHYDEARQLLAESYQLRQRLNDPLKLAEIYYRQGRLASRMQQQDEAKTLLQQALEIQTALDDQAGAIRTLRILTRMSILGQALTQARDYCHRALALAEKLAVKTERAYTLYTMSIIYYRLEDFEQAQQYNRQCTALFKRIGNQKMQALTLLALSGIQEKLGQLDKSLTSCGESEKLLRHLGDQFNLVFVLTHFCKVYIRQGRFGEAAVYGQEALELASARNRAELTYIEELLQQIPPKHNEAEQT